MSAGVSERKVLTRDEIAALPQRYRARLVNSISGFKSANLVGTADADGRTACCIVSSVVHLGSDPALMGLVFRPPGSEAHNYKNLSASGCFTLSHVTAAICGAAHQTSARYPEGTSEFDEVGLTPCWYGEGDGQFSAPAVEESPVRMGLTVAQDIPLPNGCRFVIGAVQWVDFKADAQAEDGFLDLSALGTVCIGGLDAYHGAAPLGRVSYAKPGRPLEVRRDFMQGWD
ncbi:MAG: flavin reductase [Flavobacteriales bacterium]|jgi:flavin reductase (DIM6/NTAB) family NADH-FMN oxidoreductase RutF|nr:flavin reductase [Flavobacteriales bacterium]